MTRKRSIFEHPALPLWGALWLAALVGLGVMVLPDWVIGRAVVASEIDAVVPDLLPPLDLARHIAISLAAAAVAGLVGLVLFSLVSRMVRRRHTPDWDELTSELDVAPEELAERVPRPLRVREELDEGFDAEDDMAPYVQEADFVSCSPDIGDQQLTRGESTESLEDADLATLVERFDRALDRLTLDWSDPEQPSPSSATAPAASFEPAVDPVDDLPNDQTSERAELRAALDHLARARKE